jgi:N-acetylneuraminate synthase
MLKIGSRTVSQETPPLVVAELGINHSGSINKAKELVLAAKEAGAEAVKTQIHIPDAEMTQDARKVRPPNASKSIYEVIDESSLDLEAEQELRLFVRDHGLIYIATPFSLAALSFLKSIQPDAIKIGSGEIDHTLFVREVAASGFPVIASTGMHSASEIFSSINELRAYSTNYALLQCTNVYPCPPAAVALHGMNELENLYQPDAIGFSDHCEGTVIALAAIALGAQIVEKHFIDDPRATGPDVSASMTPSQLKELILGGNEIFQALGRSKARQPEEEATYRFARSSVYALRNIRRGEKFTRENLWAKRPGTGEIPAQSLPGLLGQFAARDILAEKLLVTKDVLWSK